MNKIENIKLKNHKAIGECKLENLGKINVICGKNSSGKTTLLEAIQQSDSRFVGRNLNTFSIDEYNKYWVLNVHSQLEVRTIDQIYYFYNIFERELITNKVFPEMFSKNRIYYSDEIQIFVEQFFDDSLASINKPLYPNKSSIAVEINNPIVRPAFIRKIKEILEPPFEASFKKDLKKNFVYLNPKRFILSDKKTDNLQINNQGIGLLNKLHNLKNNLIGSSSRKLYEKLNEKFTEVSAYYKFDVANSEDKTDWELFFSRSDNNNWRSAENWGLGLQDLLVILYFSLESTSSIVLIEEPENHLHPELQRRLLQFLKEETSDDKQFFLSTHSNIFLDSTYVDRIFHTSIVEDTLLMDDATSRTKIMNDLGYSVIDNLISDLVIIVEGINDKKVLIEFFRKMDLYGKYNIKFWLLGGDLMEHTDLESFADNYKIMALLDNDPKSDRKEFLAQCKRLKIPVTTLDKYSMENYFPIKVYRDCFSNKMPQRVQIFDDNKPVWAQLGSIKKQDIKKGSEKFAKKTDFSHIEKTDLGKFLKRVEKVLQENS